MINILHKTLQFSLFVVRDSVFVLLLLLLLRFVFLLFPILFVIAFALCLFCITCTECLTPEQVSSFFALHFPLFVTAFDIDQTKFHSFRIINCRVSYMGGWAQCGKRAGWSVQIGTLNAKPKRLRSIDLHSIASILDFVCQRRDLRPIVTGIIWRDDVTVQSDSKKVIRMLFCSLSRPVFLHD